jgi:hypothetical protein
MGELHLEPPPEFLPRLAAAPHLLESQRELLEALLKRGDPRGSVQMGPALFLSVGRVVLEEMGVPDFRDRVADALMHHAGEFPEEVMAFARDVTRWSYCITAERVDQLRTCGLEDADILDLVSATALWNASARLEILLMGMPETVESAANGAERHLVTRAAL